MPWAVLLGLVILAGCGKSDSPPAPTPSAAAQSSESSPAPALEAALAGWRAGDKSTAVSRFLQIDWSARPLFAPDSPLALSEEQFKQLPAGELQAKSVEIMSRNGELKQLASAVAERGREAAAKKDVAQARKLFSSVKQCGEALDSPQSLAIVRLVAQALKKMADTELSRLPQSQ